MQKNWENLEIDDLHSASLIETETASDASQLQTINFPDYQCSLRTIRVHDMMYDPRLRLQILPGGLVPTEGIDEWTLNFVRGGYPKDSSLQPFKPRSSDREVCVLSNMTSRNFMHWTTEQLLKVIILERSGFTGTYVLSGQPDFCHVFLDSLGIPEDRILDVGTEPTIFKTAVLTMPVTVEDYPKYPGLFFLLRDSLLNIANRGLTTTPRRIWFDRLMSVRNPRDFVNRDEVYDLITRYGFQVLDMASHHVCRSVLQAAQKSSWACMALHSPTLCS